jgi:hypothetical protein
MALCLLAAFGSPARAADTGGDAAVLLKQGQRLEKEGKADLALELYKAALLVAPKNADAHRLTANALKYRARCEEAVPEFRAYLDLAPAKAKGGGDYATAVVGLATCLRDTQARLELRPSTDARCSVDGGPAKDTTAATPAVFEVSPGEHAVGCTKDGRFPANQTVTVAAKETRRVELELAPMPEKAAPPPPVDPAPPAVVPAPAPAKAPDFILPPLEDPPAPDAPLPPTPDPVTPPREPAPPVALETPVKPPVEPVALPAPPPPTVAELEIELEGRGWSCRADGGPFLTPSLSGNIVTEVNPGWHVVTCERPGAEPLQERFAVGPGDRKTIVAQYHPKTAAAAPAADVERREPAWQPVAHAIELQFAGGFSPGLGTFGVGLGGRYDQWGVLVGTGIYPFALSVTRFSNPGRSGFYLSAGYVRISDGLLRQAFANLDLPTGHGVWAGAGLDVRPDQHLSFRLGAGLGYNSTGLASGPLTLDFSVAYLQ